MTDLNALADRLCGSLGPFNFVTRDERDLIVSVLRAAASSQAGVETAPPSQEPVAWRRRRKGIAGTGGWIMCPEYPSRDKEFDLEPLYNTPPAQPAPAQQGPDPIWKTELSEIIGHLGSAIVQSTNSDDRIIMDHVRAAYEIAKVVRRQA